ncbi:hypothetical protein [Dysgonomonas reticulitermitis]
MNKMKVKLTIIILLLTAYAGTVSAQVTIGEGTAPQSFSVLEISTNLTKGGLRLPQLSTQERNDWRDYFLGTATGNPVNPSGSGVTATELANAPGLVIYNTDTGCMEYWNKQKWISLCEDLIDPGTLPSGSGTFTGRTIFDIAQGNDDVNGKLTAHKLYYSTDFAQTVEQDATDETVDGVPTTVTEPDPSGAWLYSGRQVYTFVCQMIQNGNLLPTPP